MRFVRAAVHGIDAAAKRVEDGHEFYTSQGAFAVGDVLAGVAGGIGWHPQRVIERLDPSAHATVFADGTTMPYDLFLGVPKHVAPAVVAASCMAVDGWVPVDPRTLQPATRDPRPGRLRDR